MCGTLEFIKQYSSLVQVQMAAAQVTRERLDGLKEQSSAHELSPPTLPPVAEETASDVLVITTACDDSVMAFMFCNFLYWKCPEMATLLYNFFIRKFLPEPPRWLSGLRYLL